MASDAYDGWAMRVDQAIKGGKGRTEEDTELHDVLQPRELLLCFAREASLVAGALGRHVDAVIILGADRYDAVAGFIDNMLQLDDFSLMELRYKIPAQREPGLRFRVVAAGKSRRVEVQFFEDLIAWPVDEQGKRIWTEPITFELHDGRIDFVPHPSMAPYYAGCARWQTALRDTLALPFKFLYDASAC